MRVVVEGSEPVPATHSLIADAARFPTWAMVAQPLADRRKEDYRGGNVRIEAVEPDAAGNVDLAMALRTLARNGITSVLVEGGGRIAAALLRAGLVDRLVWYRSGLTIGADGVPAVGALGVDMLDAAPRFEKIASRPVGDDIEEVYRPAAKPGS